MGLIDKLKKEYDGEIIKEEKTKKGNEDLKMSSKSVTNATAGKILENKEKEKINTKKELANTVQNKKIKMKEEEDIKILRMKNEKKISSFLLDFIEDNEINKKRANSMKSLRQAKTFSSFTTCDDSICLEDKKSGKIKINLDKIYIDNSEISTKNKRTKEIIDNSKNLYKEILSQKNETPEAKKKFGKIVGLQKNIPENLHMTMYPQFKEIEKENEKMNIERNSNNELITISCDLLLQKIIFDDFMNKNLLLIYHFCQQCFCFLKKEIFFKKLFHCYKTYKNKGIPLDKLQNLIEFINILIVEMFKYYEKINSNEMQINLIKKFYNELITDLIINIKEEENNINENKININENNILKKVLRFDSFDSSQINHILYEDSLNKNNLLNMNLNFNVKKIQIDISKENPPICKIIKKLPKKKISKNPNKYLNKIEEEIKEENNEDDSDSSFHKSKNEDSLDEDSNSSSESESIYSSKKIYNLLDNVFKGGIKFVSKKEQLMKKLYLMLSLLEVKDNVIIPHKKIKETKSNIPFYSDIKFKKKQKSRTITRSGTFALFRTNTFLNQILSKPKSNNNDTSHISHSSNSSQNFSQKNYFCITDYNPEDIGYKLTQISISLLNKIHHRELYRGVFLKSEKNETSPNVVKCINNFNKLTSFIIEDVISYDTPKLRARAYEAWVLVCDYCKTNRNYNDCLAIYSALNNYVITGLNLTTKEIKGRTKSLFENISKFCSVGDNYRKIRNDIINCESERKNFIPYLGLLLRDINVIEESYKYINEKGFINIEKIEKMNKLMEKYFKYKKDEKKKKIKKIDKSLNFLEKLQDFNFKEEDLENRANNIEPQFKFENQEIKTLTNIDKKYFRRKAKKNNSVCVNKNESPFWFK